MTGLATALAGLVPLLPMDAVGQTTNWSGAVDSNWFAAGNWSSGVPVPWSPAATSYRAIVDVGTAAVGLPGAVAGTLTVGATASGALRVENGGVLTLGGEPGAGIIYLNVGSTATGNGTVTVNGATSKIDASTVRVGDLGTGLVTVEAGGQIVADSFVALGGAAGKTGTIVVTGTNSNWTTAQMTIGSVGIGNATVSARGRIAVTGQMGLTVASQYGSAGTLLVTGAGSHVVDQGTLSALTVGYGGGIGSVTVEAGGSLTSNTACVGCGTALVGATVVRGDGTVTVTGAESVWTMLGGGSDPAGYRIGANGTGTLNVENGGKLDTGGGNKIMTLGSYAGGVGTLNVRSGGDAGLKTVRLGDQNGGIGRARIDTGSTLATVVAEVGFGQGSQGSVVVSGAGSTWKDTGQVTVGSAGRGDVTIESGATATGQAVLIGGQATAVGTVMVSDAGSSWTTTAQMTVGGSGQGTLTVQNTATIGLGLGLFVGSGGQGSVTVQSGGKLTSRVGLVGSSSVQAKGDVLITGANSSWTVAQYAWLGVQGATGTLTLADGGAVSLNNGVYDAATFSGVLYMGDTVAGSTGKLTIGGTTAPAAPGTLVAAAVAFTDTNSVLTFNHTGTNYTFAPSLIGNGVVDVRAGVTRLTGDSSVEGGFIGQVNVLGGTLYVDNKLGGGTDGAGPVAVSAGATLGGRGVIAGAVTVAGGGVLESRAGQTLGMGALTLNAASQVNAALGAPSSTALFTVAGALTLAGQLNVSDAGGFTLGNYRLFDYGGVLTNNTLTIASVPAGFNPGNWSIDTATNGQVSLVVAAGPGVQYWDGPNMTPGGVANGRSGTGIWNATNTNWTNQAGSINAPWAGQKAVFAARAGSIGAATITVEGAQATTGLSFLAPADPGYYYTAYRFNAGTGGKLTITDGATPFETGSTPLARANNVIAVSIDGTGGIRKLGDGILTMRGASSYSGGTTVDAGILVADYEATAIGTGPVTVGVNGTLLFGAGPSGQLAISNAGQLFFDTIHSVVSQDGGDATVTNQATGRLVISDLTNAKKLTIINNGGLVEGGLIVSSGSRFVEAPGPLGFVPPIGSLSGSGTLRGRFDVGWLGRNDVFSGVIEDIPTGTPTTQSYLLKSGTGTLTLTGASTHTGGTGVRGGRLLIDGSVLNDVRAEANGTLGGKGSIGGTATIENGATLEGRAGQVLTMGNLVLAGTSKTNVALGAPSSAALFSVAGALTLAGQLNVTDAGGFVLGSYRLFDYGGALTNNTLTIASLPAGFNPGDWSIATATNGQVSLVVAAGPGEQYWDGANMTPGGVANGRGGSGTWNPANTNWTNQAGTINAPWAGGIAVFGSRGGTATVTIDAGGVTSQGLRCLECQVVFKGGPMSLGSGAVVDVLQSTQNIANFVSFDSNLQALGDLTKTGNGRLTLSGVNTVNGAVAVQNGVLQITGATARLTTNGATVTAATVGTDTYLARFMVQAGAQVASLGAVAGAAAGTAGSLYVQRGGVWDAGTADVVVGSAGKGLLNVYGTPGGTTEIKAGRIVLGALAGGSGKLEIWSDNGAATLITAGSVSGGSGGGVVEFDLRGGTAPYDLAPALRDNLSVSLLNGDVRLRGEHDYTGTTTIKNGSLILDGASLTRTNVDVQKGVLTGAGTITQGVTVRGGAELRGRTGQLLTMGGLALNEASKINVTLGAPSSTALFRVTSGLVLDGQLSVTDGGGFAQGSYRLFDYGGALSNNGLVIASLPAGFNPGDWSIDTGTGGQVSLVVPQSGPGEQYWDGANMTPGGVANGRGGSGTWNVANTNWTNQAGTINAPWANQKAIFAGAPPAGGAPAYGITVGDPVRASGLDFRTEGYLLSGASITLSPGAAIAVADTSATYSVSIQSQIIGEGDVAKAGAGSLILFGSQQASSANRIDGRLDVREGLLSIHNGETRSRDGIVAGQAGDVATVDVTLRGAWNVGTADIVVGGAGKGTLTVSGDEVTTPGTLTAGRIVLGRDAGGFGTLNVFGNLGFTGQVAASEISGGLGGGEVVLGFGSRPAQTFAPKLTGNLAVQVQSGEVRLTGVHDYTGTTTIGRRSGATQGGGTLTLEGATLANSAVTVGVGGTLGGQGTIGGTLNLMGGTLKGAAGQVMTVGSLVLDQASSVDVVLGAPSATRLFNVLGGLTLDGTLKVTDAGGFGDGVYRLFDYGGALTDNGLVIGALPGAATGSIQTSIANQINLVVGGGGPVDPTIQFWNGSTTTSTGSVNGGSGAWSSGGATNWTDANGASALAWGGKFAVFQGAPGTVAVDGGGVGATGLQFAVDGYRLTGGAVTLNSAGGAPIVRVGDGSAASAGYTAIVESVLTGTSGLAKTDLGTLVLTGANTYSGGTTIAGGALQMGDGGTTGSIQGDVANNGLLRFARSDTMTFAGVVSGSGAVETRSGTLILTADNSYNGPTTIGIGATLQLGNGGTSGLIAGDVVNNGTLSFARSDAATLDGAISGSGGLQVQSGSLILMGNSSYAGATHIAAGATLQLGNGGTAGSITSNVANAGTFAFNGAGALAYGGTISGSGTLRQIGSGTTMLTGDSSGFTGTTQIETGTLSVNGKLGGTLTVLAGGQLQGVGTVGDVSVFGTIAPGNSIGTLTVGNITFQPGSIYQVEVNAGGQSDKIVATGTATLTGGSVQVLAGRGSYQANTTYTILTAAGGRTGTFAGVTSNLAFLAPSLSYDPDNVYLTLTRNTVSFPSIGGTFNQRQAGAGVESLGQGNPIWNAVVQMDAPTAQAAFNQLSGEVHASAKTALYEDSRLVRDGALSRLRQAFGGSVVAPSTAQVASVDDACSGETCQADPTTGIAAWAQGFGSWGYTSSDGNAAGLSRSTGGVLVGVDAPVFEVARLGLFGGYSHTNFNVADRQSSGGSDNVHLGAYGGAQWGPIGLRAGLAYTWHNLSTSRSVAFPGFADSLRATYGAGTFQVFGEAGYRVEVGQASFEPFANIAYMSLSTKGFSETGGAAALTSTGLTNNVTATTLGLRAGSAFVIAGLAGQARGTVGWQHAFTDTTPWANLQLAGGTPFTAAGVPIARDAALLELGIDLQLSERASVGLGYTGQFAAGSQDQSVRGTFTFRF